MFNLFSGALLRLGVWTVQNLTQIKYRTYDMHLYRVLREKCSASPFKLLTCRNRMRVSTWSMYRNINNISSVTRINLIKSGIEQNPGPSNLPAKFKQRVRKSGVQYNRYLLHSSSADTIPVRHGLADKDRNLETDSVTQDSTENENTPPESENVDQNPTLNEDNTSRFHHGAGPTENMEVDVHVCPDRYNYESDNSESDTSSDISSELSQLWSDLSDRDSDFSEIDTEDADHDIECDNFEDSLIYDSAQITLGASILLMMTFVMKHNLSADAFSDFIDIIRIHCKEQNLVPSSVHTIKKWFLSLKSSPSKHYYCPNCLVSLSEDSHQCSNKRCNKSFGSNKDKNFFVEVSLVEQLKRRLNEEKFREQLEKHRQRYHEEGLIGDICDGELFKEVVQDDTCTLTLTWNTDGVPLFKSSKTSMWPLYFCINELPFIQRRKPENLLLAGLWIGPKKPEMMTFLDPFINDLEILQNGLCVDISPDERKTFKVFLIAGTADLPAKAAVCNITQFNGKYSCPHCMQPGKTTKAGKGITHAYPFVFEGPTDPKRSHEECLQFAEIASESGKAHYGIKGPCWFTLLTSYDFVRGNCIDYMHCLLLGITKRLITLWFSKEKEKEDYSAFKSKETVDQRLKRIKPPLNIQRLPRSLEDLKYWKASELRNFLLFYGPVILRHILKPKYYTHFLLLSEGIFILLSQSISVRDIERSENLLEQFVAEFENLYSERYMTLNLHLLLHLPNNVKDLGPMWCYSCFPFEDANGYLLKLVKGTQSVESQIIDSMAVIHGLPYLEKQCVKPDSAAEAILHKLKNLTIRNSRDLGNNVHALGKLHKISADKLSPDDYIALANLINLPPNGHVALFYRIKCNGNVYHSKEYKRVTARNSFTVAYLN